MSSPPLALRACSEIKGQCLRCFGYRVHGCLWRVRESTARCQAWHGPVRLHGGRGPVVYVCHSNQRRQMLGVRHRPVRFLTPASNKKSDNYYGQLGQGNRNDSYGMLPGQMGDALPFIDFGSSGHAVTIIAASVEFSCAVFDNGGVKCWGCVVYTYLYFMGVLVRLPRAARITGSWVRAPTPYTVPTPIPWATCFPLCSWAPDSRLRPLHSASRTSASSSPAA